MTLETLLKILGSEKPFKPNGELSASGEVAYGKLHRILNGVSNLTGIRIKTDEIMDAIDTIINVDT